MMKSFLMVIFMSINNGIIAYFAEKNVDIKICILINKIDSEISAIHALSI